MSGYACPICHESHDTTACVRPSWNPAVYPSQQDAIREFDVMKSRAEQAEAQAEAMARELEAGRTLAEALDRWEVVWPEDVDRAFNLYMDSRVASVQFRDYARLRALEEVAAAARRSHRANPTHEPGCDICDALSRLDALRKETK